MDLLTLVPEFLRVQGFAGRPLLLACSGGADSTVLAHLVYKAGLREVVICHVNYGLRGAESDGDQAFIKELAARLGYGFEALTYPNLGADNLQNAARKVRYDWLARLAMPDGRLILTGHNADDQAETVLMRLFQGTGLAGVRGMLPVSLWAGHAQVGRPLLSVPRSQIEAYAQASTIDYRTDASNHTDNYLRNRIRHHVMPGVREIFPGYTQGLATTLANLAGSELAVSSFLEEKLSAHRQEEFATLKRIAWVELEATGLPEEALLVWSKMVLKKMLSRPQAKALLALRNTPTGSRYSTKKYLFVRSAVGLVGVWHADWSRWKLSVLKTISATGSVTFWGEEEDTFQVDEVMAPNLATLREAQAEDVYFINAQLPLTVRFWQKGDRIAPLGMGGKRKRVSKWLQDKKYSSLDRRFAIVVSDSVGKILLCLPGGISHIAAVTEGEACLKIKFWGLRGA